MPKADDQSASTAPAMQASPLRALTTRDTSDPTIALLDAWAIVADVLTFYRERLTNEGYLRTAQDGRALRELAALVGFQPRPGVSASAYLAYALDKDAAPVVIPQRAKAQTIPRAGRADADVRDRRAARSAAGLERFASARRAPGHPQRQRRNDADINRACRSDGKCASGRSAVVCGQRFADGMCVREVQTVKIDALANRLELTLKSEAIAFEGNGETKTIRGGAGTATPRKAPLETTIQTLLGPLSKRPSRQPSSSRTLTRTAGSDDLSLARRLIAGVDYALVSAWGATPVDGKLPALEGAYVFRVVASLFGAVAPPKVDQLAKGDSSWSALSLDGIYDAVASGGYVLHTVRGKEDAEDVWRLRRIKAASVVGRYDYLMSSRATKVELQTPEGHDVSENLETLHQLRSIVVFAGSEPVQLAPDPVADPIADDLIVLDGLYSDLPVGRSIMRISRRVDILDSSNTISTAG